MPMKVFCYICLLSLAFATASCVYDFQPDYQGQGGYVAIEGDILIGESCTFTARLSTDLLDPENEDVPVVCRFRVEASDGTVFPAGSGGRVDLTGADPFLEYRLVAEMTAPFRRTYVSSWAPVQISAPIDSLSWSIDTAESRLCVNVSTHADGPCGYYRWTAHETWEYHATYYAEHFFAFAGSEYKGRKLSADAIVEYEDGENTYYCWKDAERTDILLAETTGLSEDRLVHHTLYSFSKTDRKVSHIYHVALTQYRLSDDAYRYWENLSTNSQDVGGLFSPEPSELSGNLTCLEDPDELVLGFVNVSTCTRSQLFIDNAVTRFSRWRGPAYGEVIPLPSDYPKYYGWQYRPAWYEVGKGWVWLPKECVDCRTSGGTKDRPSWWINNDK